MTPKGAVACWQVPPLRRCSPPFVVLRRMERTCMSWRVMVWVPALEHVSHYDRVLALMNSMNRLIASSRMIMLARVDPDESRPRMTVIL